LKHIKYTCLLIDLSSHHFMGKVSVDYKLRIQTLREQGLGYRAIVAK